MKSYFCVHEVSQEFYTTNVLQSASEKENHCKLRSVVAS